MKTKELSEEQKLARLDALYARQEAQMDRLRERQAREAQEAIRALRIVA